MTNVHFNKIFWAAVWQSLPGTREDIVVGKRWWVAWTRGMAVAGEKWSDFRDI